MPVDAVSNYIYVGRVVLSPEIPETDEWVTHSP